MSARGITAIAAELGVEPSSGTGFAEVACPAGSVMKRFTVIQPAIEADAIISVCKLKTHMFTLFSGAVKNAFRGWCPGWINRCFILDFRGRRIFRRCWWI